MKENISKLHDLFSVIHVVKDQCLDIDISVIESSTQRLQKLVNVVPNKSQKNVKKMISCLSDISNKYHVFFALEKATVQAINRDIVRIKKKELLSKDELSKLKQQRTEYD